MPDLKSLIPDFPTADSWTQLDRQLPAVANAHRAEDVALARVEGDVAGLDNDEHRAVIDALEADRKELRQKVLSLDKRVAGLKIDLNLLKEKVGDLLPE